MSVCVLCVCVSCAEQNSASVYNENCYSQIVDCSRSTGLINPVLLDIGWTKRYMLCQTLPTASLFIISCFSNNYYWGNRISPGQCSCLSVLTYWNYFFFHNWLTLDLFLIISERRHSIVSISSVSSLSSEIADLLAVSPSSNRSSFSRKGSCRSQTSQGSCGSYNSSFHPVWTKVRSSGSPLGLLRMHHFLSVCYWTKGKKILGKLISPEPFHLGSPNFGDESPEG